LTVVSEDQNQAMKQKVIVKQFDFKLTKKLAGLFHN
jgi:hypothetical protein